jgi:DNA-binding response OmpR family regulator
MNVPPTRTRKRILIVEDESTFRLLLQSSLLQSGYEVIACGTGDQAKLRLQAESYNLLVMDYLLPGPNAVEILTWARAEGITTAAVIVTGFPSDDLVEKAQTLGVKRILTKTTFDITTLPDIIRGLVG